MTIASKTVLCQMRFIRAGSVFCNIGAKPSVDTSDISAYVYKGNTFFGVSNEITPPVYPTTAQPIRQGAPFDEVTTKATWDASFGQGRVRQGLPFVVKFAGTSVYPAQIKAPIRQGAPFDEVTTKSSINASEFDFIKKGAPFWVTFGSAPSYNSSQFFIMF